jgi:haloacetate dehalogenase
VFEGFERSVVDTGDVPISYATAGDGPPVLLLHGYPQTKAEWAPVAELLADRFTVVCSDLRGYGESGKPRDTGGTYSFRAMATDQLRLMRMLGHERFHVAGHDRGGRVAHRMALDAPDRVASFVPCDLVPTTAMYGNVHRALAARYWQWYFLPLPEPFPERLIGADPDYYFEHCIATNGGRGLDAYDPELLEDYRRAWRDPAMIHASCADYRAGATIDLEHDAADAHRRVACPTLVLYGADGLLRELFDIAAEWAKKCETVEAAAVPGGHFFPELAPRETADLLADFIARVHTAPHPA